jgi:hypothetical protein
LKKTVNPKPPLAYTDNIQQLSAFLGRQQIDPLDCR